MFDLLTRLDLGGIPSIMELQRKILDKALREAEGVRKGDFAKRVGISFKHMSQILTGKSGMSAIVAGRIVREAQAIGCEIDPFRLMIEAMPEADREPAATCC